MATTARVYIPTGCVPGTTCRLHIAFHGCKQNEERVNDAFTVGAGFNRWAESNNIVVLYPQTHDTSTNPNACWDWWGYHRPGYATKNGVQMAAVHRMMLALAGQDGGTDGAFVLALRRLERHALAGRSSRRVRLGLRLRRGIRRGARQLLHREHCLRASRGLLHGRRVRGVTLLRTALASSGEGAKCRQRSRNRSGGKPAG